MRATAILVFAFLAGCAAPPPPPPVASVPAGPVSFDGSYRGIRVVTGANGGGVLCGTQDPLAIVVAGNAFRYALDQPQVAWQRQRVFAVAIGPDGTFAAADGPASLGGRFSGSHVQGSLVGDACTWRFEADRDGTF